MTPDAHMVETLRLRTAALHRVSRSNDLLRRENDNLRAQLAQVEQLTLKAKAEVLTEFAKHDLHGLIPHSEIANIWYHDGLDGAQREAAEWAERFDGTP